MVWVWCLRPPTVCSWKLCKVTLRRACGTEVGSMSSLLSFVLLVLERRIQESPSRRILPCSMIKTLIWSREWRGIPFQVVALQSQKEQKTKFQMSGQQQCLHTCISRCWVVYRASCRGTACSPGFTHCCFVGRSRSDTMHNFCFTNNAFFRHLVSCIASKDVGSVSVLSSLEHSRAHFVIILHSVAFIPLPHIIWEVQVG